MTWHIKLYYSAERRIASTAGAELIALLLRDGKLVFTVHSDSRRAAVKACISDARDTLTAERYLKHKRAS